MKALPPCSERLFDLNIERILEAWDESHAVREIIANALDEHVLSSSAAVEIDKDEAGRWFVRDHGRGLRYEHLTQNENPEKIKAVGRVIGKFGIGLKDAVATLDRHGVAVAVSSKHGRLTFEQCAKHGFADVLTLHARVALPADARMRGTVVTFAGLSDRAMAAAKDFFLRFSGEREIERTRIGSILEKRGEKGRIYVAGLLIAEEDGFAFSYNITSLTAAMRKALNRERSNVGRTAYSERVKALLLQSASAEVADVLAKELTRLQGGRAAEEVHWKDVAVHACRILNKGGKCVFVTARQLTENAIVVDHARSDGKRIVTIPDAIYDEVAGGLDINGAPMLDLGAFNERWNDSFEFDWVDPADLRAAERRVWDQAEAVAHLVGGRPRTLREIRISRTMRPNATSAAQALGVWEPALGRIVIRRDQLRSVEAFASTLLHELAHARSGAFDLEIRFEEELTRMLGEAAATLLPWSRRGGSTT